MSLISTFAVQTARLQRFAGRDSTGKALYSPAETIKVRKDPAFGVKRSATGEDVGVETYVLTEKIVGINDQVDGNAIRRVEPVIDISGRQIGTEVYL